MDEDELKKRSVLYYNEFHHAMASLTRAIQPKLHMNIHSFTPDYEGEKRSVEVGVLCNDETEFPANIVC